MEDPQPSVRSADIKHLPFNLTEVDIATLAQTDEEFIPHSWEELKLIIGEYVLLYVPVCVSELLLIIRWLPTDSQFYRSERSRRFQALPFPAPPISLLVWRDKSYVW